MKRILLLLLLASTVPSNGQVFSENFDGIGPGIAGWTLYNQDNKTPAAGVSYVNAAWVSTGEEFDNNVAMSTSWYNPAATANDFLVSPAIVIPAGTTKLYWDARAYDAAYPDSYRVFVSTTGNALANFTFAEPLFTQGNGTSTGESTTWTRRSIDLSQFAGQTINIAFQNFSTDMFLLAVDNIAVINSATCQAPNRVTTIGSLTSSSASVSWTAVAGATSYDLAVGPVGFTPTTFTSTDQTTYTFAGLAASTRYQYYVRTSCGSNWVGPYSIFTTPANNNYTYGFESTDEDDYYVDGWSGSFTPNNTAGAAFYADGVQMVFSNSSQTAATNRWLFSRPFNLAANEQLVIKFSTRSTSTTVSNNLVFKVGNQPTTAAQTQTLSTVGVMGAAFTETTVNYTAPAAGTYYFSFNHNNPATPAAATSIILDKFIMTTNLGIEEVNSTEFSVYPNPTSGIIKISNDKNALLNNVSIVDLNGRVVKEIKLNQISETEINVSDLSAGMYMMTINSDKGSITKKVVKK